MTVGKSREVGWCWRWGPPEGGFTEGGRSGDDGVDLVDVTGKTLRRVGVVGGVLVEGGHHGGTVVVS